MIVIKESYSNGLFEVKRIYSDSGKKILEKKYGYKWDTSEENPISVAASRLNDYVEIDENISKENENVESDN